MTLAQMENQTSRQGSGPISYAYELLSQKEMAMTFISEYGSLPSMGHSLANKETC